MPTINYPGTPGTVLYGGMAAPSAGTLVTTFTLENWDASTSRTLFRGGVPFKKGDIPSGSVPEIRRDGVAVAAQFDERSTWSDGSLKFTVCHLRDNDITAASSASYEVYSVTGSFDNTGTVSLSSVAASDALTVEVSSLAQWDGSTSTTRGSGAALASFAAHSAVATRVTKVHSGPVCEGWEVWGMFKDGATGDGSEDAHLKVIWHVDVWKDASGSVIDTEFAAELAQDWWGVAGKYRLDYTATLKRNGTTVQAYTGIQHPYHSHWATVRTQDDHNHARRHWASAIPTLVYKFDKAYWKSTKVPPPFDPTFTPASSSSVTYTPLGNMQHRADVDGTGGYEGRGMFTNPDAKAYMLQTAFDYRVMRTNGFAGLHIPYHFRDERTRTRPSESADVANTIIPLRLLPKSDSVTTIMGLPAPKHAYLDGDTGGYVSPQGGGGVWSISNSPSHAVAYSTGSYLMEGERYMLNATMDLAMTTVQRLNLNEYGAAPYLPWYNNTSARAEMSIPITRYYAIPMLGSGEERSMAWALNLIGHAASLTPDSDPQGTFFRVWNAHCADYLVEGLTYTPPSLKAAGITFQGLGGTAVGMRNSWMAGFIIQACYQNQRMTEEAGIGSFGEMVGAFPMAMANRSLYELERYRVSFSTILPRDYSSGDPYLTADAFLPTTSASVASNILTCTAYFDYTTDDEVVFLASNDSGAPVSIPPEVSSGQVLYVVNPTGRISFQVAATKNGSPISLTAGTYSIGVRRFGGSAITLATNPPYLPNADSYTSISLAAFAYSELEGSSTVTPGTAQKVIDFMANADRTTWPAWVLTP